jgi:hypothetical protein
VRELDAEMCQMLLPLNSNLPNIHRFFRAIAELIAFQVMPLKLVLQAGLKIQSGL